MRGAQPRLLCRGAPTSSSILNGEWELSTIAPRVNGHPHYVRQQMHLYRGEDGTWLVTPEIGEIGGDLVFMFARSYASHPATVLTDEQGGWRLPANAPGPITFVACPTLQFAPLSAVKDCANAEDNPFAIDEIGSDFFYRVQLRRTVLWFRDPSSGEVFHSGEL